MLWTSIKININILITKIKNSLNRHFKLMRKSKKLKIDSWNRNQSWNFYFDVKPWPKTKIVNRTVQSKPTKKSDLFLSTNLKTKWNFFRFYYTRIFFNLISPTIIWAHWANLLTNDACKNSPKSIKIFRKFARTKTALVTIRSRRICN